MMMKTLSAGAVPFRIRDTKCEFLLLRSFKYWDFPKGAVEKDEDPWEAAMREVFEETNLKNFSRPFDEVFFETKPYGKSKVARYYIIKIDEPYDVKLFPNPVTGIIEHHEFRWVEYRKAKRIVVPRVLEVLNWANELIQNGAFP